MQCQHEQITEPDAQGIYGVRRRRAKENHEERGQSGVVAQEQEIAVNLNHRRFFFHSLVNAVPGAVLLHRIGGERRSVEFQQSRRINPRVGPGVQAESAMTG